MALAALLVLIVVPLFIAVVPGLSQAQERFTVGPQNVTAVAGTTNVRLHSEFSNSGVYPYWEVMDSGRWYTINSNESFRGQYWIDPVNGDLYIPVLKECHAGTYRGIAAIATFVYSNPATITVLATPRLQLCDNRPVCVNSTLTAASLCVIADRNPGVDWALYRQVGLQANVSTQVQVALEPYVPVHSFTCQDSVNQTQLSAISLTNSNLLVPGRYILVATDTFGQRSVSFNISIAGPEAPQINNVPNLVALGYSQSVSIPCSVQHSAVQGTVCGGQTISSGLTVTWMKDGIAVPQDSSKPVQAIQTLNGSTLFFTSLQSGQTGQYTCQASNSKGTTSAPITVYGPPDPVSDLSSSVNQEEGVVTFSWTPPTPGPFVISYSLYYGLAGSNVKKQTDIAAPTAIVSISQQGNYEAYLLTVGKYSSAILKSSQSNNILFTIPSQASQSGVSSVVIGGTLGGALVLIVLVVTVLLSLLALVWCSRLKRNSQAQSWTLERDSTTQPSSNTFCVPPLVISSDNSISPDNRINIDYEVDPKWEFPPDLLQLSEVLYEGFSTVLHKGTANGIKSDKAIDVAVKSCKDHASDDDLRALIADMEQLGSLGSHPNIISLLRVCTVENPVCMVVEYMCHGDLLGFLRASRGHHGMYTVFPGNRELLPSSLNLTSRDLINIATKIASGMTFLEERKVVHGSLCARNVLVGTSLDIKINVGAYDLNRDSLLKWMSPETLFDGTSTTYSDVWSFGVTMWELVTLGGTPYAEILPSDLYSQLLGGMRMPKPMHCAQEVYDIIRLCWEKLPMDRLSFATLHERLDTLSHSKVSFLDLQQYSNENYSQFEDCTQFSTVL